MKPATDKPVTKSDPKIAELKRKLWDIAKPYHYDNVDKLNQFLIDENFIQDDQTVGGLTADQLSVTIGKVTDWIAIKGAA